MHVKYRVANEIVKVRPPSKNDGSSFAVTWWASHVMIYHNKGNFIFVKYGEHVWFQNPENKMELIRVCESGDLQSIVVSESLLEKFLNNSPY